MVFNAISVKKSFVFSFLRKFTVKSKQLIQWFVYRSLFPLKLTVNGTRNKLSLTKMLTKQFLLPHLNYLSYFILKYFVNRSYCWEKEILQRKVFGISTKRIQSASNCMRHNNEYQNINKYWEGAYFLLICTQLINSHNTLI